MEQLLLESDQSYSLIGYYPDIIEPELCQRIKTYCQTTPDYQSGSSNSSGSQWTPRLQKWIQEDLGYFSDRWDQRFPRWEAFGYDSELHYIQHQIQTKTQKILDPHHKFATHTFNSCLLNYYRDHRDSIRDHSDDEPTFGNNPTVAVVSIGSTRTINFTRKLPGYREIKPNTAEIHHNVSIQLQEGSLLLMAGSVQEKYSHAIPKQLQECGPRYSLTFRQYTPSTTT